MRIPILILCMGILALGGCETTKSGTASSSSRRTTPVPSSLPGQMIEITYHDVTIKGPFRYHADYLNSFADSVIDNWERIRDGYRFSNPNYTTGHVTAVVRLTDTGNIVSVYVTDRSGPMDLEMQVRRCLRSTSGIPPWDEGMRKKFGDDLLVQLKFVYHSDLLH